ncbi:hypothetical protein HYPSUDRAFT_69748 [Hypholoma sublateritium FD-334 SS-4]|uniref:Uncharacterized protein n=1 Tax=Hypholoma sublateritium (strain FD-334 SS-4) TaxID=945553 RepID=A0A0D2M6D8_HYPSF|nr:hypothetical protein HYPSUDRAFT_69748 [Hypholoma sublateritium FD-334 SS-4]
MDSAPIRLFLSPAYSHETTSTLHTDINVTAQLIRSAKSGSDWTYNELHACDISITPTSPANFPQVGADSSLDHPVPSILTSLATDADDPNLSEAASEYLGCLHLAARPHTAVETRYAIPLFVCGEKWVVQADVCVIHQPTTMLLVLAEDKTTFNNTAAYEVEVQVVAEAVQRAENGRPILEVMTIPCITTSSITLTLYLGPVTKEVSYIVITDQYPASQTQVLKCINTATRRRRANE